MLKVQMSLPHNYLYPNFVPSRKTLINSFLADLLELTVTISIIVLNYHVNVCISICNQPFFCFVFLIIDKIWWFVDLNTLSN